MAQWCSKTYGESADIYTEGENYKRNKERRIILIGQTGTGKSTFGNAILGYKCFKNDGVQMQSNTTECQVRRGKSSDGKDIVVLYTPGDKKEIIKELCKCTAKMAPGPHVICLVHRCDNRFTQENIDILDEVCAFFGEDIYQYVIVVFTHKSSMGKGTTIDNCLETLPAEFVTKFRRFGGKKIAIENRAEKKEIKKQTKEFFKLIEEIVERNGGGYYSEEEFKAAEESFRKRIPKIQQEVDNLFEENKKSLEDDYQDKAKRFEEREHELEKKLQHAMEELEQVRQLKEKAKFEYEAHAAEIRKLEDKQQKKLKSIKEILEKEQAEKQKILEECIRNMQEVTVKSIRKIKDSIVENRS